MMLTYEAIRIGYQYWFYRDLCAKFSNMMIACLASNGLWIVTSLEGFNSINSGIISSIRCCLILLLVVLMTRIGIYSFLGYLMKKEYELYLAG